MKNMAKARNTAASAIAAQFGSRLRLRSGETGADGSVKVSTSRGSPTGEIDIYLSNSASTGVHNTGTTAVRRKTRELPGLARAASRQHKANRFSAASLARHG